MQKIILLSCFVVLVGAGCSQVNTTEPVMHEDTTNTPSVETALEEKTMEDTTEEVVTIEPMQLKSTAFAQGENIPAIYTCDGAEKNPPLTISGVPEGTKSLALVVDDPDAPVGTWVHWVVWNIDPATTEITEDSVPTGALQGKNGSGMNVYEGPCPPGGTHRYFFKLYALDTELDLPVGTSVSTLEQTMEGHVLEEATLMGKYGI